MLATIERICGLERQSQEQAQERYAALLIGGDDSPATEREIRKLLDTLGKTAADLQADFREVETMNRLQAQIEAGYEVDGASEDLAGKLERHNEATRTIIEQRRVELRQITTEQDRVGRLQADGDRAVHAIDALRHRRLDLFASVATPAL